MSQFYLSGECISNLPEGISIQQWVLMQVLSLGLISHFHL